MNDGINGACSILSCVDMTTDGTQRRNKSKGLGNREVDMSKHQNKITNEENIVAETDGTIDQETVFLPRVEYRNSYSSMLIDAKNLIF